MKLLLFDIDGTLIHTHGVGMQALEETFREILGIPRIPDHFSFAGLTDLVIVELVLEQVGRSTDTDSTLVPALFRRYVTHLERILARSDHLEVLPGVRILLEELRGHGQFALALGTGNIEPGARHKLERVRLNEFFPVGGFGSDARSRAEILRVGKARAEVHYQTRFSDVWVVGDTAHDIRAGQEIGAKVLAVASGFATLEELVQGKPDALLDNLLDTPAILTLLEA